MSSGPRYKMSDRIKKAMSDSRRSLRARSHSLEVFPPVRRKAIPQEFVLEEIASLSPTTRPMFGCLAVYVGEKIVLILRDKPTADADNGVWLATTQEHHASLQREFPNMRSIGVLGQPITGWQILPADSPDFEEAALKACELIIARDPRMGKIPRPRASKKP